MTAINFPDSPTVNQEFTAGDVRWVWTGVSWNVVAKTSDPFIVSETAPASPDQGDQWYDSNTGATFVYYDGYWVELNNSLPGPQGEAGPQGAVGAAGATGATGPTGVVTATSPLTYNSGTQTVGINLANLGPATFTGRARIQGTAGDTSGVLELRSNDGGINYIYKKNAAGLVFAPSSGAEAMTVDPSGRIISPFQPTFTATSSSSNTQGQDIVWGNIITNIGSHFNATN